MKHLREFLVMDCLLVKEKKKANCKLFETMVALHGERLFVNGNNRCLFIRF